MVCTLYFTCVTQNSKAWFLENFSYKYQKKGIFRKRFDKRISALTLVNFQLDAQNSLFIYI